MGTVVLAVDVVRDGTGGLGVSWELSGAGPVELSVGPTPESVGRGGPVARVDGATRTSLAGLGPGRHYVSVAPVGGGGALLAAERVMPLEGASNFRDLGGYRVRGGGRTRWGMVFRADAPDRLTAADLAAIGQLGLRVAYDLRTDDERSTAPSALPAAVRSELLAIGGDAARTSPLGELFRSGRAGAVPDDFLQRVYLDMAEQDAPALGRVLTGLAAPDGVPAVIHCTAGKDRTGWATALVLLLLGADVRTVEAEYLSVGAAVRAAFAPLVAEFTAAGGDPEIADAVFGVRPGYLHAALQAVADGWGDAECYARAALGLKDETLGRLRENLTL